MSKEELNLALEKPEDMDFYLENTGTKEIILDIEHHSGSFRDQFAMAALPGIISRFGSDPQYAAKSAYTYADEMMEARG